jgi:hypothetical protein
MAPELLEARVARLATVAEAARALLAALPRCARCGEARATLEPYDAPGDYCAPCAALAGVDDRSKPLPHAAPAEALERALDAAVAAALAGEP